MNKKKVEVTNKQILEIGASLNYLNQRETEAWFEISKNSSSLKPFIDDINESKKAIFDKYAVKNEDGSIKQDKGIIDFGENADKANELWDKVQNDTVKIEVYQFSKSVLTGLKFNSTVIAPLVDIVITE